MLLEAALNGGRSAATHRAIPVSASQLAAAAAQSARAGAGAVHFHVRAADGSESLDATDVARAVTVVRRVGVPFGISTGAWIISDPARRLAAIEEWTIFPDFASINFDEAGAAELGVYLLQQDVGIEAGVANALAAQQLVRSGLADRCLRVMFEPREQVTADAMASVAEAEKVLDAALVRVPRLLHGLDATAWPLVSAARARGYDTRIGFEDTLTLPDGTTASDNGELVQAAAMLLSGGQVRC
jgi:uncharacterized protein (DUF849 family)